MCVCVSAALYQTLTSLNMGRLLHMEICIVEKYHECRSKVKVVKVKKNMKITVWALISGCPRYLCLAVWFFCWRIRFCVTSNMTCFVVVNFGPMNTIFGTVVYWVPQKSQKQIRHFYLSVFWASSPNTEGARPFTALFVNNRQYFIRESDDKRCRKRSRDLSVFWAFMSHKIYTVINKQCL